MENNSMIKKSADARIVQAVRRLKSTRPKEDNSEARKNQEDTKQPKIINSKLGYINDNNSKGRNKKNSLNLGILNPLTKKNSIINNDSIINNHHKSIILNNNTNSSNSIPKTIDINKSNSKIKITIDGSVQKPDTSSTNKTSSNKIFDYETLKKYKKRKISDFQKNLLSKKSLEKYKEECVSLVSKDVELKTLFDQIGINKPDDYLIYINNNFFNKEHFLFTLEILIFEAVEEANTLKVFRTNKNVLPLKVVKENYYRDEIIKDLKKKIYEEEYNNKFKNLMKSFDNFIDDLKKQEL